MTSRMGGMLAWRVSVVAGRAGLICEGCYIYTDIMEGGYVCGLIEMRGHRVRGRCC